MAATEALRNPPPHGQKREPEDDLEDEQPLSKRFNLLNLDHNGKVFIPVQERPPPIRRSRSNAVSDTMNVDESRDRIYIYNLDEELADISSDDEKLIFLPDIEKRLNRVPKSVLATEPPPKAGNEVVLYSIPASITVPKEQDNVRKAIIESRQRASEQALETEEARQKELNVQDQLGEHLASSNSLSSNHDDSDAMDLS